MKDLIFVGGSALSATLYSYIKQAYLVYPETYPFNFLGVLDDSHELYLKNKFSIPYLGKLSGHEIIPTAWYVLGLKRLPMRVRFGKRLENEGAKILSFVHPSSNVPASAQIGLGSIIGPNCTLGESSIVGDFGVLLTNVLLGEEVSLGKFSFVSDYVHIDGPSRIGEGNEFGKNSKISCSKIGNTNKIGANCTVNSPDLGDHQVISAFSEAEMKEES
jgi:acetyltransferase-like isoleucine patch superfamily enzyme